MGLIFEIPDSYEAAQNSKTHNTVFFSYSVDWESSGCNEVMLLALVLLVCGLFLVCLFVCGKIYVT